MDHTLPSAPVVLPLLPVVTGVLLVYFGQFMYSVFQLLRRSIATHQNVPSALMRGALPPR